MAMARAAPGALALLALLVPASAALTLSRDLSMDLKTRPIMKVVRMLEDMKTELNKEMEDDKAVYELLTCWCETGEKEKTKAIEMGQAKIAQLTAAMGEFGAKIMEMKAKRKATQEEMYADQKALGEAREMRMKENKEFHGEETDLMDAIASAKDAIVVLSKHNPELAQVKAVAHSLQNAKVAQLMLSAATLSGDKVQALKSFLLHAQTASSFLAIPGMTGYAPQSGQIFGILKQMKEDFEGSLSAAQKAEAKSVADFEMLKAAKTDEIATAEKLITQLDEDLAAFGEKNAQAMEELTDTEDQLALDQEFLKNLQSKCATADAEFDARMKGRLQEIAAVEDTIKFLNSDEAYENFDKTTNTAFLQTSSNQEEGMRRQRAVAVLRRAAGRAFSPKLAMLATAAQLDAFTKVKAEIDKMVAELTKQQADEVEHRDWCIAELNTNTRDTAAAYDKKASLEAKQADLSKTIESLTAEIEATNAAIAEMKVQMKKASEIRESENADFQQIVIDQRMTQAILTKAADRMKVVYGLLQQPGAAHTQTSATHTDPGNGPARFTKYEKNAGGARVVAMIEEIIADSAKTEDEAIASEQDAQTAYEDFMKGSNKSITESSKSVMNMTEDLAKAKEDLSMAKTDFKRTMGELEGLNTYLGDLKSSCDFLLQNFDARQAARAAEIDALGEAKNILSGMK